MSVRILLAITLAAVGGGAQASSLFFPGAPTSTPSIISIGAPQPLKTADAAKAGDVSSVVMLGEAEPDVTYEKVAAIPDKSEARHGFKQSPMIIRGGVVGPSFPTPTAAPAKAAAPATGTAPATGAAPAAGTAPATATASAAPSGNAGKQSNPAPSTPAQAATQPMPASGNAK